MLATLSNPAPRPPKAGNLWNHYAALPALAKGFIAPMDSKQAVTSFACIGRLSLKEQRASLPLSGNQ